MNVIKQLITISAMSSAIMEVLDMTIVNVALHDIQGAMSCTPDQASWILTSYMIATGIFMPLTGLFSHKYGLKNYFLICVIGFTVASAACGLSDSIDQIIVSRLLQGAFGAGLVPLSQAMMINSYPSHQRGRAVTIWGMGIMTGPIFGPTVGGFIIEYLSWHWIFFINVPLGIMSAGIAYKCLPPSDKAERQIDWIGMFFLALGIGALQYTLDRGNREDWFDANLIRITTILAFVGLSAYIYHCKYFSKHPIFSLNIFKDRNFAASCLIMFFLGISIFSSIVIIPIMLSTLFNYTALQVGLVMAPRALTSLFTMFIVGKIINKFPVKYFIGLGLILSMISSFIAASTYNLYIDQKWIVAPFILQGIGMGMSFTPLTAQSMVSIPRIYLHEATGVFNLMRIIGGATGIAIVITYYSRQGQLAWQELGGFINPYNPNVNAYLQNVSMQTGDPLAIRILAQQLSIQSDMQAIINSLYLIGACTLLVIPLVLLLDNQRLTHLAPVEE